MGFLSLSKVKICDELDYQFKIEVEKLLFIVNRMQGIYFFEGYTLL